VSEHQVPVRSYRPGQWFGIVGERAVVILPPSEKARVASLWELVDGGAGFDVTLDALISGGLRDLPSFVLVSTAEGETKVVLRGPARASFTVDGEEVELEGSSATTWVERSLHGVERMSISVDDAVEAPVSYSVDGGLFRISALEEAPAHEGAPEYDPGPAPVQAVAPDLEEVDAAGGEPYDGADGSADDDPDDRPNYELTTEAFQVAPIETEPSVVWADPEPAEGTDDAPPEEPVEGTDEQPFEEPVGLDALFGSEEEAEDSEPDETDDEASSWAAARSPEPPSWTPDPPTPPPVSPPPTPFEWGEPVGQPQAEAMTEAMTVPPDADHDGLTRTGSWQAEAPQPPGIPGQPPAPDVTRPVARLMISNGESVEVDRAIVIGRAPEGRRFSATEQPRLVTVPSPNLEISATHVEVRPGSGADHGSAVVTDLGSTNGTVLVQPGLGPEDLEPGVAVQLIPGAVIDLGDGVTIQVLQR
jgi:hypothetical protein